MTAPRHHALELTGTEFALINAASFLLANWPFENEIVKTVLTPAVREAAAAVEVEVASQWRTLLSSRDLWDAPAPSQTSTQELMNQRARIRGELRLTDTELPVVVLALRLCVAEFGKNWADFIVAAPGGLNWYPGQPEHLTALAHRLERAGSGDGESRRSGP